MKGGDAPIHFMRWAAADYVEDPWVKLAASRGDTGALAFYSHFLNHSHIQGGYLPSEPEHLAAALGLPLEVVKKALPYWSSKSCGLVRLKGPRAWNPRVVRDIQKELEFRRGQAEAGRKGGLAHGKGRPKDSPNLQRRIRSQRRSQRQRQRQDHNQLQTEDETPGGGGDGQGAAGGPPPPPAAPSNGTEPLTARPERCPACKATGTLRFREDGTGWFCGPRLGGCDAKFAVDDTALLEQLPPEVARYYAHRARPELAGARAAQERRERVAAELAQCEPAGELWDAVLRYAETQVNPHSYATWWRPTYCHGMAYPSGERPRLYVGVPSKDFLEWFARNYAGTVWAGLWGAGHSSLSVWLATPEELQELPEPAKAPERREE